MQRNNKHARVDAVVRVLNCQPNNVSHDRGEEQHQRNCDEPDAMPAAKACKAAGDASNQANHERDVELK